MNFRPRIHGLLLGCLAAVHVPSLFVSATPIYEIGETPGTYLQTNLTHEIYRYATDSRLGDLIVTDSSGNELPFRITAAETRVSEQSNRFAIEFYPVVGGTEPESWLSRGKALVHINGDAISVSVDGNSADQAVTPPTTTDFYLLDLTQLESTVDSLVLDWQPADSSRYLEVEVSGSNDLQSWSAVARDTLVQLQKDGQSLVRNEVSVGLRANQYDFLRLRFPGEGRDVELNGIDGLSKTRTVDAAPVDTWQVDGRSGDDQQSALRTRSGAAHRTVAAWEYRRDESVPVGKVRVELGTTAYGDTVRLFSRASERDAWRVVHTGIWLNVQVGDDWQHSEVIGIYPNSDPFWRLEMNNSMRGKITPALVFEHPPQTLQFIANNNAPYRIAVMDDAPTASPAGQVFSQVLGSRSPNWIQVDKRFLNPPLPPPVEGVVDWARRIFWLVLLVAVAVLVGFALRLYKQMEQGH